MGPISVYSTGADMEHTSKPKKRKLRNYVIVAHFLLLLIILVMVYSNYHINTAVENRLYSEAADLPHNKVGLILGTSKYLSAGGINPYFQYRIDAAVELYRLGKVDYLLASGDNSQVSYNEPKHIHRELLDMGVPEEKIFLDYAGFRTLDSVVRCKEVFGQDSVTIISQKFHNQRAVFIAGSYGIEAVGYSARTVPRNIGLKVMVREVFAKVKAMLDIYLFRTQPKFLGEEIRIP